MSVSVHDLSIARGGIPLLEGVHFDVPAGQALILRGPNGIGKTTLLRTISGLQPVRSGRIELAPDSVTYAGHSDGVKNTLTVAENLQFWADIYGHKGITSALESVKLKTLADRPAGMLSAGQKRRLGLSRLLVTGRSLWLLDEPTVSLDASSIAMFSNVLEDHLQRGGSAVIASHVEIALDALKELDLMPFRASLDTSTFLEDGEV
ncbi:MAG: heme ABC exporter ATP-binding protein CcmA [Pseudomonadota bacterium]